MKPEPAIVTAAPTGAAAGVIPVISGLTTKSDAEVVPATAIRPVSAAAGTVSRSAFGPSTVNAAGTPPTRTDCTPPSALPSTVTTVPVVPFAA